MKIIPTNIIFLGEANVYTLGDVGKHRVVTTKLPMTGSTRDALIATGSTTTRLLGTFQVSFLFTHLNEFK